MHSFALRSLLLTQICAHAHPHRSLSGLSLIKLNMEIQDLQTLEKAIESVAPICSGWALNDRVGDLRRLAEARRRKLMYREFEIPKRTGGFRKITAPTGKLKDIQKCLSVILETYYNAPECVHGFTHGCSVASNARKHIGKNYVLNIDIKDFFPTISYTRIMKSLEEIGFTEELSDIIARICTIPMWDEQMQMWRHSLPQGSPASPLLSNIVCKSLDTRLTNLAHRYCLDYSRYADDITFSSNHSVYAKNSRFIKELEDVVKSCGFTINEKKTRLQKKGSRQEVTGLIIGEKVNTYRQFRKNLRAAVFHAETNGCTSKEYNNIMGRISYLSMVRGKDDSMSKKFAATMSKVTILR